MVVSRNIHLKLVVWSTRYGLTPKRPVIIVSSIQVVTILNQCSFLDLQGHVFLANLWNRPLYPNSPFKFGGVFYCNSLKVKLFSRGPKFCLVTSYFTLKFEEDGSTM